MKLDDEQKNALIQTSKQTPTPSKRWRFRYAIFRRR